MQEHFPASRITYILPGQSTVLSAAGRAVEVEAISGATLGPPWQQAENGYFIRPAAPTAADGTGVGELTSWGVESMSMFFITKKRSELLSLWPGI